MDKQKAVWHDSTFLKTIKSSHPMLKDLDRFFEEGRIQKLEQYMANLRSPSPAGGNNTAVSRNPLCRPFALLPGGVMSTSRFVEDTPFPVLGVIVIPSVTGNPNTDTGLGLEIPRPMYRFMQHIDRMPAGLNEARAFMMTYRASFEDCFAADETPTSLECDEWCLQISMLARSGILILPIITVTEKSDRTPEIECEQKKKQPKKTDKKHGVGGTVQNVYHSWLYFVAAVIKLIQATSTGKPFVSDGEEKVSNGIPILAYGSQARYLINNLLNIDPALVLYGSDKNVDSSAKTANNTLFQTFFARILQNTGIHLRGNPVYTVESDAVEVDVHASIRQDDEYFKEMGLGRSKQEILMQEEAAADDQ